MAVQPDTTVGTITLTSGQKPFTTSGVNMLTRGHMPGDAILVNGLFLVIETIINENSGTLRDNCPAEAAGTALPVRIRYQPDGSRVAAQTRNLIDIVGNGNVLSLGGLSITGNKGIMGIGSGALGTFDLSVFARTLLDDTSANSMLETLGVSSFIRTLLDDADELTAIQTLGLLPVQTGPLDTATGKLLRSAAYGLGPGATDVSDYTVAEVNMARFFRSTSAATGGPGFAAGVIAVPYNGTPTTRFIAIGQTGQLAIGSKDGINGTPVWYRIDVQRGSNSNGQWARFSDGTQICWSPGIDFVIDISTGSVFRSSDSTWTYPASFIEIPVVTAALTTGRWTSVTNNLTTASIRAWSSATISTPAAAQAIAVGRWQ